MILNITKKIHLEIGLVVAMYYSGEEVSQGFARASLCNSNHVLKIIGILLLRFLVCQLVFYSSFTCLFVCFSFVCLFSCLFDCLVVCLLGYLSCECKGPALGLNWGRLGVTGMPGKSTMIASAMTKDNDKLRWQLS